MASTSEVRCEVHRRLAPGAWWWHGDTSAVWRALCVGRSSTRSRVGSLLKTTMEAEAEPEPETAPLELPSPWAPTAAVCVIGASGDLAKRKTYPALFKLFLHGLLPSNLRIWGYARSANDDEGFREGMRSWLAKAATGHTEKLDEFLAACCYCQGQYDSAEDFARLNAAVEAWEAGATDRHNRMFYLAIPPSVFGPAAQSIKASAMAPDLSWTRVIVEKPFGHDLASSDALDEELGQLLSEDQIYRIDHYLGKEMVQNLAAVRVPRCLSGRPLRAASSSRCSSQRPASAVAALSPECTAVGAVW